MKQYTCQKAKEAIAKLHGLTVWNIQNVAREDGTNTKFLYDVCVVYVSIKHFANLNTGNVTSLN